MEGGRAEFRHLDGDGGSDPVLTWRAGCVFNINPLLKCSPHEEPFWLRTLEDPVVLGGFGPENI